MSQKRDFPCSLLEFKSDAGLHPTQKPVALFEYLIKTYTNEGDLVLDNCAGSGTTGVACLNTGRDYILIEKEPKYIEIINARIAKRKENCGKRKSKRAKLIDKLDGLCREITKVRDDYTCQHCGKKVEGTNAHWSHVIPRSRGNALRWDLINAKTLCYHCHMNWWHKNPVESGDWFKTKFPARWQYLESKKHESVKFTEADLEQMIEERKGILKQLKD